MEYLLQHSLRAAAETAPDRVAVIDGDRSLTYEELELGSNRLANLLGSAGVARGDRVGLYLDKSVDSIVAIYAALKVGAAYVPLDPQAPVSRLSYIARDCDLRVLVTGKEKAGAWIRLIELGAPVRTFVVINAIRAELPDDPPGARLVDSTVVAEAPSTIPRISSISLDLAYILYTSGSTGDPKGVMLSHRNGLAFVDWAVEEFSVTAADRISNHAPLHFDLSIFDIFAAAHARATLILVPHRISVFPVEVARFIDTNQITIWYSVPSLLTLLTERANLSGSDLPQLRTVLFAGEVFPTKYLRRLMALLPHVRFCNLYGPTETNVCTWYDVLPIPEDQTEPIPIGRAIADVEVFNVTDDGRRAARGDVGELYARGPTVMQGYWGDEDRTRRSLLANPLNSSLRDPVYRTGDLVREDEHGNYQYLGRRDAQVKSRGYRIELGEVETVLYANPSVAECAVLAIPDDLVTNRLVACVVVRDDIEGNELLRFCSERIPSYMVPERFQFRDELPKTSTGKVDRQMLIRELGSGAKGVRREDAEATR